QVAEPGEEEDRNGEREARADDRVPGAVTPAHPSFVFVFGHEAGGNIALVKYGAKSRTQFVPDVGEPVGGLDQPLLARHRLARPGEEEPAVTRHDITLVEARPDEGQHAEERLKSRDRESPRDT